MSVNKYSEYRWKWENYPKLCKVDKVPIHLDMEVTTRCNLRCIMCEHSFNPPKPLDLPLDLAKKIIDEFTEKGVCSIKFCYLGEPLLYEKLPELIQYAKQKGVVDTIVATNGNLLNTSLALKLIKAGLDNITFSVDSCQEEVYKQIRVGGSLHKVVENVVCLQSLKQIKKSNFPQVRIQAIPMDINREELSSKAYESFWYKYADSIRISPYCEDYTNNKEIGETPNFCCESPFRRLTLRADGMYALCCGERRDYKIVGDATKESLESVWNGIRLNGIRTLMKERKSHLINECKTCMYRLHGNNTKKEEIIGC